MAIKSQAPAWDTGAQQVGLTGYAGNDSAVTVVQYTTPPYSRSILKARIVVVLGRLFETRPSLARGLGQAGLLALWLEFRRA